MALYSYDVGSAARLGRGVSSDNPTVVPSTQRGIYCIFCLIPLSHSYCL